MGMLINRHRDRHQTAEPEGDLSDLKVADLKAYAKDHEVDLDGATRKDDIIAAIRAAESSPTEPEDDQSDGDNDGDDDPHEDESNPENDED